jgi:hypothetical protein
MREYQEENEGCFCGRNIAIGCFMTVILTVILGIAAAFYVKKKVVTFVADTVRTEAAAEIRKSPIPDDQKEAWIAAVNEICDGFESGDLEIDITEDSFVFEDRKRAADTITKAVNTAIGKLDLPADQKTGLQTEITRLGTAFKDGKLNEKNVADMMETAAEGAFGVTVGIWGFQAIYVYGSGLNAEEKANFELQLGRVARGVAAGSISPEEIDTMLDPYSVDLDGDGDKEMKDALTDDELREILEIARRAADDAQVSSEPYKPDLAGELKKAVDAGLGE